MAESIIAGIVYLSGPLNNALSNSAKKNRWRLNPGASGSQTDYQPPTTGGSINPIDQASCSIRSLYLQCFYQKLSRL